MDVPVWLAITVGIISVARTARLLVFDDFPPIRWVRLQYLNRVNDSWGELARCAFCLAPYLAVGQAVYGGLLWDTPEFFWWWFVPNGIWAASYLAAILVAYDVPE